MKVPRQKRPPPGIDMSPMIDCVFQLLIFFMLSSSFMTPMIKLNLPKASYMDQVDAPEIMVTVDEQGVIHVNTKAINPADLQTELAPLIAQSKEKIITFRGDEKAQFHYFIKVLDAAKTCGAANVNIAHRHKEN